MSISFCAYVFVRLADLLRYNLCSVRACLLKEQPQLSSGATPLHTFRAVEIALYHGLGALPEPDFTHRFC